MMMLPPKTQEGEESIAFVMGLVLGMFGTALVGFLIHMFTLFTQDPVKEEARCMVEHQVMACERKWVPVGGEK